MTSQFNAEEVLEIACQIERNGCKFYRAAAELVELHSARELLLQLADMEDGHEAVFEDMKSHSREFNDFLTDPDGTAASYLKAIAGNHVFVSGVHPEKIFGPEATARDVLREALNAEFASIAFFQGIFDNMPSDFGRDKLKKVIMEEQEHVVIINKKIISLASRTR
ncbi:MAG: ferritin family protein [Deltaproteobacteria bacterium]|nr:ferritin family protein [Deltaproteobacteria bacterium]